MATDREIWQHSLSYIQLEIPSTQFRTWFKDTVIVRRDGAFIHLGVPSKMCKDWLSSKYHKLILKTLRSVDQDIRGVEYSIIKDATRRAGMMRNDKPRESAQQSHQSPQQTLGEGMYIDKRDNLNPRYTFDTFVVGPFNQLAHAAAQAVIGSPGITYNPLFIYGDTGRGKTHLIQSVGNHLKKINPSQKVIYVTSERFTVDYLNAIRTGKANQFKDKYRQYDVLIMDDIQFIADKEKTQEELFHLFNAMFDNNKQIIFSSDVHPANMLELEDRLKSRFSQGMIAEIPEPDTESRMEILKEKVLGHNIELDAELISLLASEIRGNIRELEGILNTLVVRAQLKGEKLTEADIKNVVRTTARPHKSISVKDVVDKIARYYEIDEQSIYEKTRKKEVVKPRQIIMYILRNDFNISYPLIGEKLGGRDHTTVIHSCEKIKKDLVDNALLEQEITQLRGMINNI